MNERRHEDALKQIDRLGEETERRSPPVSTVGHQDPWVDAGKKAVKIAREALGKDGRQ
jgi:hypothetical protein